MSKARPSKFFPSLSFALFFVSFTKKFQQRPALSEFYFLMKSRLFIAIFYSDIFGRRP